MKTMADLLSEREKGLDISYESRIEELETLVPELKTGKKIYYNGKKYIYIRDGKVFSGMDNYIKDCGTSFSFSLIFFLSGIYCAKNFAGIYDTNERMKADRSLKKNELGFIEMKDYGVIGNESIAEALIEEYKAPFIEEVPESEIPVINIA